MPGPRNASNEERAVPTQASIAVRLTCGIIAGIIPLVAWRIGEGHWPSWHSSAWYWLLCSVLTLLGYWLGPFIAVVWRLSRPISRAAAPSPGDRLAQSNFWTEVTHVQDGGASQVMRMDDGNFILLSVGTATVEVFVAPRLDSFEAFRKVVTLPIPNAGGRSAISRRQRRQQDEELLERLRKAIGWPRSVDELSRTVQRLSL
jgi:hypothetical protein